MNKILILPPIFFWELKQEAITSQRGGVTAETFQAISDLMRAGGKRRIKRVLRPSFKPGSIPTKIPQTRPQRIQKSLRQFQQNVVQEEGEEKQGEETPKEWTGPKIYKGTSIS